MRVGQKNKLTYRWARKGSRPRAAHDQRTQSTYLFGAVSGNSCGRTGCRTEFSNPSTISSITAAMPGTLSSISPGRSCPSRAAIGRTWVIQCEDWYNIPPGPLSGLITLVSRAAELFERSKPEQKRQL